jgi:hypothetical protein
VVVHTYNPSYLRVKRLGELWFKASLGKKLVRYPSQPTSQVWWCRPITLDMHEIQVGGWQPEIRQKYKILSEK